MSVTSRRAGGFLVARRDEAPRNDRTVRRLPKGGAADLDLAGTSGRFTVAWLDPRKGGPFREGTVREVGGGTRVSLGTPPSDPGDDWLAVVRRR